MIKPLLILIFIFSSLFANNMSDKAEKFINKKEIKNSKFIITMSNKTESTIVIAKKDGTKIIKEIKMKNGKPFLTKTEHKNPKNKPRIEIN